VLFKIKKISCFINKKYIILDLCFLCVITFRKRSIIFKNEHNFKHA